MNRVVVTKVWHGPATMQVCAEKYATDDEILAVCNRENPSGTSLGWSTVVRDDRKHSGRNPVPCADTPGRLHILVDC